MNDFAFTEEQIRTKVIELLDGMSNTRLDMWLFSGTAAEVIDYDIAERVLNEEIHRRSPEVANYWLGEPCNCNGQFN